MQALEQKSCEVTAASCFDSSGFKAATLRQPETSMMFIMLMQPLTPKVICPISPRPLSA